MRKRRTRLNISSPLRDIPIFPISQYMDLQENVSSSNPKESGTTTIDISISLSNNNNQSSTSVSYSNELDNESVREVKQLIEMFVRDVAEEFSRG